MSPSFAKSLDALSEWRAARSRQLAELGRFLADHALADDACSASITALRSRLAQERLVVAFVAEFSRGKSELINAIFFGDAGRRILPATPGRTTMCPVELAWEAGEPPTLRLLPIETRLDGHSLAELRPLRRAWSVRDLPVGDADGLAEALREVTRTRQVDIEQARALGFWDDARADDNPPLDADGRVEIPAWRHALINYPHPLLQQGLVVIDTPGLNAIGAEPELTLGLLPSANATVFVLGADTGVTRSDLGVWRDHLGSHSRARFVVLNKIDALRDPLATRAQVHEQIAAQCVETARTLGIAVEQVFPLSARQALAARIAGDDAALAESRLPALEAALATQLLPQRREVLARDVHAGALQIEGQVLRRLGDERRLLADQAAELRGLRGKSAPRLQSMLQRVDAETAEFEQCTVRLQALRVVQHRMFKHAMGAISSETLRAEVTRLQSEMAAMILNLGTRRAFVALCARLQSRLVATQAECAEITEMLQASFARLNADFGFSLVVAPAPVFDRFRAELTLIEDSYVQYLGLTQALRLSQPSFMEQFRRMLIAKLRVVFENAGAELEVWMKATASQLDLQLRERRRHFRRRRDTLVRVQTAASGLESRIAEIDAQDARLQDHERRACELLAALRGAPRVPMATTPPVATAAEPALSPLAVPQPAHA